MTWTTLNVRLDTVATKLQSLSSSADEVSSKIQDAELRLEQLKNAPIGTDYAATRGLGSAGPLGPGAITNPIPYGMEWLYKGIPPGKAPIGTDYAAIRGLGPAGPSGPGGVTSPIPYGMEWLFKGTPLPSGVPGAPSNTKSMAGQDMIFVGGPFGAEGIQRRAGPSPYFQTSQNYSGFTSDITSNTAISWPGMAPDTSRQPTGFWNSSGTIIPLSFQNTPDSAIRDFSNKMNQINMRKR